MIWTCEGGFSLTMKESSGVFLLIFRQEKEGRRERKGKEHVMRYLYDPLVYFCDVFFLFSLLCWEVD